MQAFRVKQRAMKQQRYRAGVPDASSRAGHLPQRPLQPQHQSEPQEPVGMTHVDALANLKARMQRLAEQREARNTEPHSGSDNQDLHLDHPHPAPPSQTGQQAASVQSLHQTDSTTHKPGPPPPVYPRQREGEKRHASPPASHHPHQDDEHTRVDTTHNEPKHHELFKELDKGLKTPPVTALSATGPSTRRPAIQTLQRTNLQVAAISRQEQLRLLDLLVERLGLVAAYRTVHKVTEAYNAFLHTEYCAGAPSIVAGTQSTVHYQDPARIQPPCIPLRLRWAKPDPRPSMWQVAKVVSSTADQKLHGSYGVSHASMQSIKYTMHSSMKDLIPEGYPPNVEAILLNLLEDHHHEVWQMHGLRAAEDTLRGPTDLIGLQETFSHHINPDLPRIRVDVLLAKSQSESSASNRGRSEGLHQVPAKKPYSSHPAGQYVIDKRAEKKVINWSYHPEDASTKSWRTYETASVNVPVLSDHQRSELPDEGSSSSAGTSTAGSLANVAVAKSKALMRNKYSDKLEREFLAGAPRHHSTNIGDPVLYNPRAEVHKPHKAMQVIWNSDLTSRTMFDGTTNLDEPSRGGISHQDMMSIKDTMHTSLDSFISDEPPDQLHGTLRFLLERHHEWVWERLSPVILKANQALRTPHTDFQLRQEWNHLIAPCLRLQASAAGTESESGYSSQSGSSHPTSSYFTESYTASAHSEQASSHNGSSDAESSHNGSAATSQTGASSTASRRA